MLHDDVTITAVVHPDGEVDVQVSGDWDLADPLEKRSIASQADEALRRLGVQAMWGFPAESVLKDTRGNVMVIQDVHQCAG